MLPPWTRIFIKSIPDSSACLYQVRIFMFSPIAAVNVKFSGPISDAVCLFKTFPTLLFLQKLCSFFYFYNHFISPYLLYSVILMLYLWKDNLLIFYLLLYFRYFSTPITFLATWGPPFIPALLYLGTIYQCFLWSFSVQLPHLQTSKFFLLPLPACS